MNLEQTARVLAKAAAFDFRTVGETDVRAWHEAIGDLDAEEALAAVSRWYRDRADRLMPSHLREAVKLLRAERRKAERVAAAESAMPPGEEPARRLWAELEPEERERLSGLSRGLLAGERFPNVLGLLGERYAAPAIRLNGKSVYGGD